MKIVCKCNSEKVHIMSVKEKTVQINSKDVDIVSIDFICNDCGKIYNKKHYLYKEIK